MRWLRHAFIVVLLCGWAAGSAHAAPALGSTIQDVSAASELTLTLTGVSSGSAVYVIVGLYTSAARTFTVSDSEGTGNVYASVVNNNCGTARCLQVFGDVSISEGDGTLAITIDQSATHQNYTAWAIEIESCTGGCVNDTSSFLANTAVTSHPASANSTVIDTTSPVVVFSACVGNGPFGTEADSDGAGSTWLILTEDVSASQAMGQYRVAASPLTDERATMTGTPTARDSWCAVVSVGEAGGSARRGTLMGVLP